MYNIKLDFAVYHLLRHTRLRLENVPTGDSYLGPDVYNVISDYSGARVSECSHCRCIDALAARNVSASGKIGHVWRGSPLGQRLTSCITPSHNAYEQVIPEFSTNQVQCISPKSIFLGFDCSFRRVWSSDGFRSIRLQSARWMTKRLAYTSNPMCDESIRSHNAVSPAYCEVFAHWLQLMIEACHNVRAEEQEGNNERLQRSNVATDSFAGAETALAR